MDAIRDHPYEIVFDPRLRALRALMTDALGHPEKYNLKRKSKNFRKSTADAFSRLRVPSLEGTIKKVVMTSNDVQ